MAYCQRVAADFFRRPLGALGQQVADPLAPRDHVHHLHHRVAIAKAQLDAPRVLQGQQALFKALHGKGDRHPAADGVQRVGVAQLGGLGDGHNVVHAAGRAQRAKGLVFRPAIVGVQLVRGLGVDQFLAAHRAGPAAGHAGADLLHKVVRAEVGRAGELAVAKVADRQVAAQHAALDAHAGAILVHRARFLARVDRARHLAGQLADRVRDRRCPAPVCPGRRPPLSFLDPITAPMPVRPAASLSPFITQA